MRHTVELVEEFIRAYFDKLLLTAILLLLVYIGSHATANEVKSWAMGQANTVIGAIIMLTTGKIVQRMTNGNGHEKTSVTETETVVETIKDAKKDGQ